MMRCVLAILTAAGLVFSGNAERPAQEGQAVKAPVGLGAGGFPVTFVHAASWIAEQPEPGGKVVRLMVYFAGSPGWPNRTSGHRWTMGGNPATIEMKVGERAVRIAYWRETLEVEILGEKLSGAENNVILVEGIDGPKAKVSGLGMHDLMFAAEDNPAVVLLRRNEAVRAALLGGNLRRVESLPAVAAEVLGWDKEGSRLRYSKNVEDQRKACEYFRQAAERGYAESQYSLGYCYESGEGVKQDYVIANEWYEKAAKQGVTDAQYKLGHSYRVGRGTEINLRVALEWYKKAAENGDADGQHNVGWMTATGMGVEANAAEAYRWFLMAAKNGEVGSQFEVARRLNEGDGVTSNVTSAYAWLLVLREQRGKIHPDSFKEIEMKLQPVESKLDEEKRKEAKQLANDWMIQLAKVEIEKLGRR